MLDVFLFDIQVILQNTKFMAGETREWGCGCGRKSTSKLFLVPDKVQGVENLHPSIAAQCWTQEQLQKQAETFQVSLGNFCYA